MRILGNVMKQDGFLLLRRTQFFTSDCVILHQVNILIFTCLHPYHDILRDFSECTYRYDILRRFSQSAHTGMTIYDTFLRLHISANCLKRMMPFSFRMKSESWESAMLGKITVEKAKTRYFASGSNIGLPSVRPSVSPSVRPSGFNTFKSI